MNRPEVDRSSPGPLPERRPRVGLFVPCYVDQLAPEVGLASLRVLERAGCEVVHDRSQICCGQPLLNAGAAGEASRVANALLTRFAGAADVDAIVCPSASCTSTIRNHYREIGVGCDAAGRRLCARTFELGEFLVKELGLSDLGAVFRGRVALLQSCHGLRELGLGTPSERAVPGPAGSTATLLRHVRGLELVEPERDECCGFGGTFSVKYPRISERMGRDRLRDLGRDGAEWVVGTDVSCLLHLDGLRRRHGAGPRPLHLAELLDPGRPRDGDGPTDLSDGAHGSPVAPAASRGGPSAPEPGSGGVGVRSGAALDRRAGELLASPERLARHDASVFSLRERRDAAVAEVEDFEALRDHAAALKDHTLARLDDYLREFEEQARQAGAQVHWAVDAAEHNRIVAQLLEERGLVRVVKSKSILTEECGLNAYLEERGIEVVDTDLGERIVQLRDEPPSHIIVPAIHTSREDIGRLFHESMGTPALETDPKRLTEFARVDLRPRFLEAEAGLTGVNFAVAETGSLVVVTNEGNADLGMSLPALHIASMGIEKLIPRLGDLPVFLRLLARSATGQPISAYTSVVTGPRPGAELHVVIVDNGRARLLADPGHRRALACIRCGACLNTCPVYRRAGGYAYAQTVPGPIGAVLAPALGRGEEALALPHASSLCGSCSDVCPVKIDLHGQLLAWRRERPVSGPAERVALRIGAAVLARPRLFRLSGRVLRALWPALGLRGRWNPLEPWLGSRALPQHPGASFARRYRKERRAVRRAS